MCRVYRSHRGTYVRLCYVHGKRRGEHIPVPENFVLKTKHYQFSCDAGSRKVRRRSPVNRCMKCGAPMSRHRYGLCEFCEKEEAI